MSLFNYRALDRKGKQKKGQLEAENQKQVISKLHSQELIVEKIWPVHDKKKLRNRQTSKKLKSPSITRFTRHFSTLISTGVPYDRALEVIIAENEDPNLGVVISDIRSKVRAGSSLSGALESEDKNFGEMYIAMIRAGETGGTLAQVMDKLADFREKKRNPQK